MSNTPLDVALRISLERKGFAEGKRDIAELERAAKALGGADSKALPDAVRKTGEEAKKAKDALQGLGAEEAKLKTNTGLDALHREAARLERQIGATEQRTRELRSTADKLQASDGAQVLQRQLAQVTKTAEKGKADLDLLRRAAEQLGTVDGADALAADLARISTGAERAGTGIDDVRRSIDRLGSASGAEALSRDLDRAAQSAQRLESQTRQAARATQSLRPSSGSRDFLREGFQQAGGSTYIPLGVGAAGVAGALTGGAIIGVGAAGASSARRAMGVETSMADVRRSMNDPTDEQLRVIEEGTARLARKTGIRQAEYLAFITEAAKAGTKTEDLLPFADFGSKFALAADMDNGKAGDDLAKLRNNYNLDLKGQKDNADTINFLADNDAAKERNIVEFMLRSSGGAKIAGISANKMTAFGTVLDSSGVSPEVAGTSMNALVMRLGTAGNLSRTDKDFGKALRKIGLSGRGVEKDFYKDGAATITDILKRVSTLPQDQQLNVLKGLGGLEYADDFSKLAGQIDKLEKTLRSLDDPKRAGSVERTFDIFDDQTAQDLKRAAAAISDLGAEIGKEFLPAIRAIATIISDLAGGWADSIRRERQVGPLTEKMVDGKALTPEDQAALAADPKLKGRVDAEVYERLDTRRQRKEVDENRDLRLLDDEEEQKRAAGRTLAERSRGSMERELADQKMVLGLLSPEQPGYADAKRQIGVLERKLDEINRTLKEMGGVDPISFRGEGFGGGIIKASLGGGRGGRGGGGGFNSAYNAGGGPVMDGMANVPTGGGARAYGGGGGSNASVTRNPGGGAGEVYDVLSAEFSDPQSLALLGHMEQESGFDPNAWNAKEGAGGLLQWRGNRLENLKKFASERGMDWKDRKVQAAFVGHEMRTDPYERQKSEAFRTATTVEEASAALKSYVRFGDNSAGTRLANARRYQSEFGATGAASAAAASGNVTYANKGATRNRPVTANLMEQLQRGVSAVYGEGYRAEIYSGGQAEKGSGGARTGSTRHDDHGHGGQAADVYVYGPDGKKVTGDELAKLGQHWVATGQGGVGMEMRGGGIHLDEHKGRAKHWNYRSEGGSYTPAQAKRMRQGLAGVAPEYANPSALDPAKAADAGLEMPTARVPAPTRRPTSGEVQGPMPQTASRARGQAGPIQITQKIYGSGDPRLAAARAQREQHRAIRMAESGAMHDTMVPIS